jgi:hypothetical protein
VPGPTAVSSSSSSSNTSVPGGPWQRSGYINQKLDSGILRIIADPRQGLTALPLWQQWGDQQLLSAWNAAVADLPSAVEQLAAVSVRGPVKLVCFDLETSDSKWGAVAAQCNN